MKILAISDVPSKLLWDESVRKRLEGIDLILSCGDLPKKISRIPHELHHRPILYVHGNHDGSYKESEPGGCICVDDAVYVWKGLRIMGLGGRNRYNRDDTFQYTEAEMRRRVRKLWLAARRAGGIDILLTHAPASGLNDGTDKAHKGFQVFNDLDGPVPAPVVHPRAYAPEFAASAVSAPGAARRSSTPPNGTSLRYPTPFRCRSGSCSVGDKI